MWKGKGELCGKGGGKIELCGKGDWKERGLCGKDENCVERENEYAMWKQKRISEE